ncbi:MAG: PEP/pyruvate-binding domain-containing protein [Candidatus Omnitrophota bacterium]|nr:PEP/pyruvate-binding domain-containing protein [Candidatus Omnitrophota bacterium]
MVVEYFGSSPILVRSSSLLEDDFGNAFAGKYESIFLANQGTPEQRYIQFAEAVKKIYASTMNEDALVYRKQRGLDKLDEQMALLVQRVSGSPHKNYFFPDLAGVGVSYNTYVWNKDINPEAGMLRLVFGLGTRAVNRVEGDYPRMVALSDPSRRPYAEKDDLRKYSQHMVDLINTKENVFQAISFEKLVSDKAFAGIERIADRDDESRSLMRQRGLEDKDYWILTLDKVLDKKALISSLKKILELLAASYHYPIEIEFTINFTRNDVFKINLLQCRPLQTRGLGPKVKMPEQISKARKLFQSNGYFLGGNISQRIDWVIYVNPQAYGKLTLTDKYETARIIGNLNKIIKNKEEMPTLLMGPGRWGTTTPSLGVPVKFAEINNVAVLAEVAFSAGNLMPELSFGTHFFQDLVETNIFYVALFPEKENCEFNITRLTGLNNSFAKFMPEAAKYDQVIGVYDLSQIPYRIMSDVVSQKIICFQS